MFPQRTGSVDVKGIKLGEVAGWVGGRCYCGVIALKKYIRKIFLMHSVSELTSELYMCSHSE